MKDRWHSAWDCYMYMVEDGRGEAMDCNGYLEACYGKWKENIYEKWYPLERAFICPRALCADGFEISIQASEHHYCTPRETGKFPYKSVELGYPSERDDTIMDYAEYPSSPQDTIYPYVPVDLVDEMLESHGGILRSAFC